MVTVVTMVVVVRMRLAGLRLPWLLRRLTRLLRASPLRRIALLLRTEWLLRAERLLPLLRQTLLLLALRLLAHHQADDHPQQHLHQLLRILLPLSGLLGTWSLRCERTAARLAGAPRRICAACTSKCT